MKVHVCVLCVACAGDAVRRQVRAVCVVCCVKVYCLCTESLIHKLPLHLFFVFYEPTTFY